MEFTLLRKKIMLYYFIVYKTVSYNKRTNYSGFNKFAWSIMKYGVSIKFHGSINRQYYSYIKVSNDWGRVLSSEQRR